MDIHLDTSLMCILEDDSISLTSRTSIYSCSNKGVGLWLVVKPFIYLFRIAHFIFTLTLHFCLSLIQPLRFSLFTCKCAHNLNAFGTHLIRCLFAGQQIATRDTIPNVMYALAQENGHVIWKE